MSSVHRKRLLREKMRRANRATLLLKMNDSTTFIGSGTTGSQICLATFRLAEQFTNAQIPLNTRWGVVDADGDSRNSQSRTEMTLVRKTSLGRDGAGTNLANGFKLATARYEDIYRSLLGSMSELMSVRDVRFSTELPPSECQTVCIIGGSGGTSGGANEVLVTAATEAATAIGLSRLNLVHVTIGCEMPFRDIERSLDPDRIDRLMANYAETAMWRFRTMATQRPIRIHVPGRGWTRVPGSTRVSTYLEFDWASETNKLRTVSELSEMMAASLFYRFFTAVGSQRASRACDDVMCGLTGQISPMTEGVTH